MRIGRIVLLSFAIAVASITYYLAYHQQNMKIVTLEPSNKEFKKKPKNPGGIVIPNSNSLIYEQLKPGNNYEVMLPSALSEPESPMNIIYKLSSGDKLFTSIDEILDNIDYYEGDLIANNNTDNILPNAGLPEMVISKGKEETASQKEENDFIENTRLNILKALEGGHKLNYLRAKQSRDEGGYKIQLETALSENEAREEWNNIKQKHSTILNDASLILRKVDGKNERIFYLVMAGTYSSLSSAKLVCNKLSLRHQNCIITK